MRSPFPGMNPYRERETAWSDFHNSFLVVLRDQLQAALWGRYIVKIEETLYIHEPSAAQRLLRKPDVSIVHSTKRPATSTTRTATLDAPAVGSIPLDIDFERLIQLEIFERDAKHLVTAIEMLSLTNKFEGPDRQTYLAKRRKLLSSNAHFVEIDFLRVGPRMPVDGLQACDFCVIVSRAEQRPAVGIWHIDLKDPLPKIPMPLAKPKEKVVVDLQKVFEDAFDRAAYVAFIYESEPKPRLKRDQQKWAHAILAANPVDWPEPDAEE